MKVIIVGCGRLGVQLAHLLDSGGNDVTVIDKNKDAFYKLGPSYKGKTVEGIGFDKNILIKAGVETADALAAVTNGDNTNIVTVIVARKMFRVPSIVVRIYDPIRAEIYRKMGIPVVSPTTWGANKVMELLSHKDFYSLFSFGSGEVEIIEIDVPITLEGRSLIDISIDFEVLPVCIVRDNVAMVASRNSILKKGDKLYLSVTSLGKNKLGQMPFKGG
jgi:trk system potassium uptake protein TrkA